MKSRLHENTNNINYNQNKNEQKLEIVSTRLNMQSS